MHNLLTLDLFFYHFLQNGWQLFPEFLFMQLIECFDNWAIVAKNGIQKEIDTTAAIFLRELATGSSSFENVTEQKRQSVILGK